MVKSYLIALTSCYSLSRSKAKYYKKIACLSEEKQTILAGEEGFEPSAYGFGDRRSTN